MDRSLVFIIAFGLFLIFLISLGMSVFTPNYSRSVTAHVKVDDYVGINLDTDKLYFGTVSPGNIGRRSLKVLSGDDAFVIVAIDGLASDWIVPNNKSFYINSGEKKGVKFEAYVPPNTPYGNYTAKVSFLFYQPITGLFVQ